MFFQGRYTNGECIISTTPVSEYDPELDPVIKLNKIFYWGRSLL